MNRTLSIIVGLLIILAVLFGIIWWLETGDSADETVVSQAELTDFTYDAVERRFVATGRDLSQVEIEGVPTDASAETENELLGEMTLENDGNDGQTWVMEVPQFPLPIEEIVAIGYDEEGAEAGRVVLGISGAEEIYNTLWLQVPFEEAVLSVGESYTMEDLTLKLIDIAEDSRCPVGVQCIQAGRVTADLEITLEGETSASSLRSDEGERRFGDYYVSLVTVSPEAREGVTLSAADYELTFYITKDIPKI